MVRSYVWVVYLVVSLDIAGGWYPLPFGRSFLVNMEYIKSISYKAITMEHLAEIPIPHGKFAEMKEKYLGYIFNRRQVFLL